MGRPKPTTYEVGNEESKASAELELARRNAAYWQNVAKWLAIRTSHFGIIYRSPDEWLAKAESEVMKEQE